MIKEIYFCDTCGKEMSAEDYDRRGKLYFRSVKDINAIYTQFEKFMCSSCSEILELDINCSIARIKKEK